MCVCGHVFEFAKCKKKTKTKKTSVCVNISVILYFFFFHVSPSVWKMCVSFPNRAFGKQEEFEKKKKKDNV